MVGFLMGRCLLSGSRSGRGGWIWLPPISTLATTRRVGSAQLLVARARDTQIEVKLPVRQGQQTIPAAELAALADAITARRVCSGPDDRAFLVAGATSRGGWRGTDG